MSTLHQIEFFAAPAATIFTTFMDEKKHAALTGAEASIDPVKGGQFSVWDGYATGTTIELIPESRIVQQWRASDWPENVTSTLTLELISHNEGTQLSLTQEGIPEDDLENIKRGWIEFYWEPLREKLAAQP